jgi:hypothetical protein
LEILPRLAGAGEKSGGLLFFPPFDHLQNTVDQFIVSLFPGIKIRADEIKQLLCAQLIQKSMRLRFAICWHPRTSLKIYGRRLENLT